MTRSTSRAVAILCGFGAATTIALPSAEAASPSATSRDGKCTTADTAAVTLVIDHQQLGGGVDEYCVSGLTAAATGFDVLKAAGVAVAGTVNDGQSFVCRLNGIPGPSQVIPIDGDPGYREQCVDTPPPSAYWSYWYARPGGDWTYSQLGAMSHVVTLGGFEGWSFALNATPATAPKPGTKPVPLRVRETTPTPLPSGTPAADKPAGTTVDNDVVPTPAGPRRTPSASTSGAASPTPSASSSGSAVVQPSQVADLSSQVSQEQAPSGGGATVWALAALVGLAVAATAIVIRRGRDAGH